MYVNQVILFNARDSLLMIRYRLSKYVIDRRRGLKTESENELELMTELVEEHSTFVTLSPPSSILQSDLSSKDDETVLLTGATGALGAHILAQLRSNPSVGQIICLLRAQTPTAAFERVTKSLQQRGHSPLEETSTRVICVPIKLSDPKLGLSDAEYQYIASTTSVIIHAAWAVNFSARLRSFAKDHIGGTQHLINLALSSPRQQPPKFLFCSSTASVLGNPSTPIISESVSEIPDPHQASPLGYSRSKWVAEQITLAAHKTTRLNGRIAVLRIGQLCGDTQRGIWNTTEAWPLMLSSLKATGALPDLGEEKLDWLPVDLAATAVVEIALSSLSTSSAVNNAGSKDDRDNALQVYHILNSKATTTWTDLHAWLRQLNVSFEVLPPALWVRKLESSPEDHPAKKLLGLWKEAYGKKTTKEPGNDSAGQKGGSETVFKTSNAETAAPAMKSVGPVDEALFAKIWQWLETEMEG